MSAAVDPSGDRYRGLKRPGFRTVVWYVSLLLYYVHLPLLFLSLYMWISPPSWMFDIVALSSESAPVAGSKSIPGVGFVSCCFQYPQPASRYFVYGSSSCPDELYSASAEQPFDLEDVYKPFFPCVQPDSEPWPEDSSHCPSSATPYYGQYPCGLNTLVSSINPIVGLARFIVAAVILKEVLKCVAYGLMHRRYGVLQADSPYRAALNQGPARRMAWFSRNVLMLPYALRYGWEELQLRSDLEQRVHAGKVKVALLDLVLQSIPQLAYTALVFVLSDSMYVFNSRQVILNVASMALSALLILLAVVDVLGSFCCCCLPCCRSSKEPEVERKEQQGKLRQSGSVVVIYKKTADSRGVMPGRGPSVGSGDSRC
jgi:hypothetical protein